MINIKKTTLVAGAVSALLMVAACATSQEGQLLSEDPAFSAGFGDGCATALEESKSFSTKRVADRYKFEENRAYRAGWRQGYLDCEARNPDVNNGGRILGNEPDF